MFRALFGLDAINDVSSEMVVTQRSDSTEIFVSARDETPSIATAHHSDLLPDNTSDARDRYMKQLSRKKNSQSCKDLNNTFLTPQNQKKVHSIDSISLSGESTRQLRMELASSHHRDVFAAKKEERIDMAAVLLFDAMNNLSTKHRISTKRHR